ncbi:hypothetical protein SAMD00023353_0502710 [Rosellinia necatrix]|uniref:Uncharacterized protein n=1 Tax=Rosellinia necatrix TaxID=77044 RepID=A0A1S7UKR6_ROSNE|nr:hypothetical protein SAMD00023353_0502710 [Rosellinia necatrix]
MPKTKADALDNVDDRSDSLFVTRSRKKKNKISRLEEYDEDPGRAGSQKYQRLANLLETCTTKEATKSKTFLKEFRRDVKKKDIELKAFRHNKEKELEEKSSTLLKCISLKSPDEIRGRLGVLRKEDHPLFKQARANIEIHRSLMKQFKLAEEQLKSNKLELPMSRWKQDKEEIRGILACGGRYGEALVGSVLAPEITTNPIDQLDSDEEQKFAKEWFKDSREALHGETWGHVAEEQLKQFSAIARIAQPEEG